MPPMMAAQGLLAIASRRIAQFQEVFGRRSFSKAGGQACGFEKNLEAQIIEAKAFETGVAKSRS